MKDRSRTIILSLFVGLAVVAVVAFIRLNLSPTIPKVDPGNINLLRTGKRACITDRDGVILASGYGSKRYYPFGALFSSVLGYANPAIGVAGLEARYGEYLAGTTTGLRVSYFSTPPSPRPLKTPLSLPVQTAADKALGPRRGAIVVMGANTGEIWAQVSHPSYNPNNLKRDWEALRESSDAPLFDRTSGRFPPGSVMKIADVLAIKNLRDSSFTCTGSITVDGHDIRCTNPHGKISGIQDAFSRSCNCFFIRQVIVTGNPTGFFETARKLGFIVPEMVATGGKRKQALAAIGQGGVLLSPMEGCRIASAIANDGRMVEPVYVMGNGKGTEKRVLEAAEAKTLQGLMESVVKSGTGRGLSDLVRYGARLGVKTGTAQVDGQKGNVDWAVGYYSPGRKKQVIAFAVVVEDAEGFASDVCLPIVRQIIYSYRARAEKGTKVATVTR